MTPTIPLRWLCVTPFLLICASLVVAPATPQTSQESKRVVFLAIDSLDPRYINLNADASGPGSEGDWLMPNVRRFIAQSAWWPFATSVAPHSTDVNHLAAISATDASESGMNAVINQTEAWDETGLQQGPNNLTKTRYSDGQPRITTLFDLVKAKTGGAAKTALLSNKHWVTDIFRDPEDPSVDVLVDGYRYPSYVPAPQGSPDDWWDSPLTDPDRACDPEHLSQTFWLNAGFADPIYHPRDRWIAEATVAVVDTEDPDMLYVLLGDLDHGQHFFGALPNPAEWAAVGRPTLPPGCPMRPQYRLVSRRNPELFKEPILDLIREVDASFGWLVGQLLERNYLDEAIIVLLSDHSMVTHLYRPGLESQTEIITTLQDAGLTPPGSFRFQGASSLGYFFWRPFYKVLDPGIVARAKAAITSASNLRVNPATGAVELPWHVFTREDMRNGVPAAGLRPGALFHEHIVTVANDPANPAFDDETLKSWPDLIVMTKNGWQLTPQAGSRSLFNAGHGAPDTAPAVIATIGLDFPAGAVCLDKVRLPDIALSVADALEVEFTHDFEGVAKPLQCSP